VHYDLVISLLAIPDYLRMGRGREEEIFVAVEARLGD
jgi:hypothetical protein